MFIEITEDLIVQIPKITSVVCRERGDKSGYEKKPDTVIISVNEGGQTMDYTEEVPDFEVLKRQLREYIPVTRVLNQ